MAWCLCEVRVFNILYNGEIKNLITQPVISNVYDIFSEDRTYLKPLRKLHGRVLCKQHQHRQHRINTINIFVDAASTPLMRMLTASTTASTLHHHFTVSPPGCHFLCSWRPQIARQCSVWQQRTIVPSKYIAASSHGYQCILTVAP